MQVKSKKYFILSAELFLLFAIFTALLTCYDVQPIGPEQSKVGFATINQYVFHLFGVHLFWYEATEWLGILAVLIVLAFASVGLYQLVTRRSLRKVDGQILVLGLFYGLVAACYLLFELVIINYRPVLLGEGLEASYPSSHTVLIVCVMATAAMQFRALCPKKKLCLAANSVAAVLAAVTVVGRLISGVHWFTDIAGGLLLSAALIALYCAAIAHLAEHQS